MREREKHTVDVGEIFRVFDEVQIREAVEVAMNFADRFSGLLVGGDEDDVGVWMEEQNAEQLRAAVTGAAEYAYSDFGVMGSFG